MKIEEQPSPWQAWALKVQQTIQGLEYTVGELQKQLKQLNDRLEIAEAKPSYNIESIEYHFDQLKVEQLDGTLNIGMSAPAAMGGLVGDNKPIEQLSIPQKGQFTKNDAAKAAFKTPAYDNVLDKMKGYLGYEGLSKLQILENEYRIMLDPHHRRIIMEDIEKQLPGRIRFYIEMLTSQTQHRLSDEQLQQEVLNKTKHDSEIAMQTYLKQLQKAET